MSAFTEPFVQVREALTSLYGDTDVRFDSRVHLDTGLAALAQMERLATTYETALQQIDAISPWADASGHRVRQIARAVLFAREEGTA